MFTRFPFRSVEDVSTPLATPDHGAATVRVKSYRALSEGESLTAYQVNAPNGSCIVQVSWSSVMVQPTPSKSLRSVGAGAVAGVPA